jgi:two-component system, cell cycle sensor histidine kinase and response regulator CckA
MSTEAMAALLDALIGKAPIGMAVFDKGLRYVYVNAALAQINGLPPEAHQGRTIAEVLPHLADVVTPLVQAVLERGEAVHSTGSVDATPPHPHARRHWVGTYVPLEIGGMRYVGAYVEERTAQFEAERAQREEAERVRAVAATLDESERRFRNIVESAPIGIVFSDVQGQVVLSNPEVERIAGRTVLELQGDGWRAAVHPDDREAIATSTMRYLHSADEYVNTARVVRPDGEVRWVELHARNLFNGDTRTGRLTMVADITERNRMEAALRESEALFRELADNVDAVFYLTSPGGEGVNYVSPGFARIWGREPAELVATPGLWMHAIHPDDIERVQEAFARDSLHFRAQYRVVRPDGSVRWISDRCFPVRNAEGEVVRVAGVAVDDTARHTLEEQLLQAQRLESIGRLAGGVAHDFNNLLTVILSHAAFARQDPGYADEDLTAIERAGARAAELTAQLLAFARRQVIEPKVVDLNDLTAQVDRMLRRLLGEQVQLETTLQPGLWPVKVDPAQMEQVLVNLAVNARDAMPNGGTLTLETGNVVLDEGYAQAHADVAPGEYVLLAVSDSGEGIAPSALPLIFEPFFTTKPSGAGTGLGLATCYGIVKQAGGHIWAYSEPGQGATFKIYLPRVSGVPTPAEFAAIDPPLRGSETVLLVEDDESVRAIAARALAEQGFTVLEARDGVEALEVASGHTDTIHLVITDVVMPRMGGKELVARLREERPEARALYASGYTRNAIVQQGVLEPGTHFLQKPYVPATLTRKVREVLDGEWDG